MKKVLAIFLSMLLLASLSIAAVGCKKAEEPAVTAVEEPAAPEAPEETTDEAPAVEEAEEAPAADQQSE